MPPKSKRQPSPVQQHLKHSRQLLEDYLYQFLPHLSGLGAISRINLFTWFRGKWGLTPDASGGVPYMLLDALRLQRQHQLQQKKILKPFSLTMLGTPDDAPLAKALLQLQEINRLNPAATLKGLFLPWQEIARQLQAQLLQQPPAERNLLLLDPLELPLPRISELLVLLPKKVDVLLLLPAHTLQIGFAEEQSNTYPQPQQLLAKLLPALEQANQPEASEDPAPQILHQLMRTHLADASKRYAMAYAAPQEQYPLLLYGLTTDALMMEKMLLAKKQLEKRAIQQQQTGAQLGIFGNAQPEIDQALAAKQAALEQLLSSQAEWSNQEMYQALLQLELLPQEGVFILQELITSGKLEVLDDKKKRLKESGALPINHTASKLPAPSRFFRQKGQLQKIGKEQ